MTLVDALPLLFNTEGIYSNTPGDLGGETVYGISRANWPHWAGWSTVDSLRAQETPPAQWGSSASLIGAVKDFYMTQFWLPGQLDYLPEAIQQAAFGCAVNQGIKGMAHLLQMAIHRMGHPIIVDGDLGPGTLAAANAVPALWLADSFRVTRSDAYLAIVDERPEQGQFLHGWENRLRDGL